MKRSVFAFISLIGLCVALSVIGLSFVFANIAPPKVQSDLPAKQTTANVVQMVSLKSLLSTECALKPVVKKPGTRTPYVRLNATQAPLARFRQPLTPDPEVMTENARGYRPKEVVALADASNFGDRFLLDANSKPVAQAPIIVLHETVGSAKSALGMFRTYHPDDDDQVSYHTLIGRDGTIFYIVPPDKRAYGAGSSVFVGQVGNETVKTNPSLPPSVNNFAYHISLETPSDGNNNNRSHSGYTYEQYQSLSWLVAKTGIPNNRITTHKIVDRSRSRMDPRSFDAKWFATLLDTFPRTSEISPRCTPSSTAL